MPKKYFTEEERKAARVQDVLRSREKYRDEHNARRRAYAKAHPEMIRKHAQKHYWGHHDSHIEYHRNYRQLLKAQVIEEYGGKCECCGEAIPEFLTIDHKPGYNNMKPEERGPRTGGVHFYLWLRKNGFPKEHFALLCFNCNLGKKYRAHCPHHDRRADEYGIGEGIAC